MPSNETIFNHLFHDSPIGVVVMDKDGYFQRANRALINLLEYTDFELELIKYSDITHPLDLPICADKMDDLTSNKIDGYEIIKRYISKTGKIIWVRESRWVIKEENKPMTFVSQIVPITPIDIKVDKDKVIMRPSLSVGQFVADNLISFGSAAAIIISVLVFFGSALAIQQYKINELEKKTNSDQSTSAHP